MARAFIGFGGNLGDVEDNLRLALESVAGLPHTRVLSVSSLYRTAPVGFLDQPDFVNGALGVETALAPEVLLQALLEIERSLGRTREVRWGPRTVDLDLILYGDAVVRTPDLEVPHSRLAERGFVLVPLAEIAPGVVEPGSGKTVGTLLEDLGPTPDVTPLGKPAWARALEEEPR